MLPQEVSQYNLQGIYLRTYKSLNTASKAAGIDINTIKRSFKTQQPAGGFYWRMGADRTPVDLYQVRQISEQRKAERKPLKTQKGKYVAQYTLEGKLIETYVSTSQASKVTGISKDSLYKVLIGKNFSSKGFIWKYINSLKNASPVIVPEQPKSVIKRNKSHIAAYKYAYQNLLLDDMDGEIWKEIKDYEGIYMISNMGRIKSLDRITVGRWGEYKVPCIIRTQDLVRDLCLSITLHNNGVKTKVSVARLVYSTFVHPLPVSKSDNNLVSHKNNDSRDNRIDNLQLLSKSDCGKQQFASCTPQLRIMSKEGRRSVALSRMKAVSQYTSQGEFIRSFESITVASRETGINQTSIGSHILGIYMSAGGFIWQAGGNEKPLPPQKVRIFQNRDIKKPKTVSQYDLKGNYIRTYPSTGKAASAANLPRWVLSYRLNKKEETFSYNGYIWSYVDSKEKGENIIFCYLKKRDLTILLNRNFAYFCLKVYSVHVKQSKHQSKELLLNRYLLKILLY